MTSRLNQTESFIESNSNSLLLDGTLTKNLIDCGHDHPHALQEEDEVSIENNHDAPFIGTHLEAPDHMYDNKYILRGYRINFRTYKGLVKTMCMVHNETVNIWSHFIGFLAVFTLFFVYAIVLSTQSSRVAQFSSLYSESKLNFPSFVHLQL